MKRVIGLLLVAVASGSGARVWARLDALTQDVRCAVRVLRRVPTFSVTACVILSAGIGLNLTFFHLVDVTMLQPLAVKEPGDAHPARAAREDVQFERRPVSCDAVHPRAQ